MRYLLEVGLSCGGLGLLGFLLFSRVVESRCFKLNFFFAFLFMFYCTCIETSLFDLRCARYYPVGRFDEIGWAE